MRVIRWQKYTNELSASFFEKYEDCENKKGRLVKIFLVEGWRIEGRVTKVVEWIVMNVGLLILHKTKVRIDSLVTTELLLRRLSFSLR